MDKSTRGSAANKAPKGAISDALVSPAYALKVSAALLAFERGRRDFSGQAQENIVERVTARSCTVPINFIPAVKEVGKPRFAHAPNKAVNSR